MLDCVIERYLMSREGIAFYKKNAADWNMCIFFESANTAWGYIAASWYDFVKAGTPIDKEKDEVHIYIPEEEFLEMINKKGSAFLNFDKVFNSSMNEVADGTPWLEKFRYRRILKKQMDLKPSLFNDPNRVHSARKELARRWFESFYPFLSNYSFAKSEFFPGVISSHARTLQKSIALLSERDFDLNLDDLIRYRQALEIINQH